jgi:hypothetical protein
MGSGDFVGALIAPSAAQTVRGRFHYSNDECNGKCTAMYNITAVP